MTQIAGTLQALQRSRREIAIAGIVTGWVALGLILDMESGIAFQYALGALTWLILILLLRGEDQVVRSQVAVAVVFATLGEYTLTELLGLYTYRLGNVPLFVPPGHGMIYLTAIALARSEVIKLYRQSLCRLALVAGCAWALWGVMVSSRGDVLGFLLFLLFAGFIFAGRSPLIYIAAFLITSYLELLGTSLSSWTWAPSHLVTMGNPPSGVAGVYCVLDAIALAFTPQVLRLLERLSVYGRHSRAGGNPVRW